jgi:hypothetical protein
MTKLVLATVASFALVSAAVAADFPRREPAPVAAVGKAPVGKGPVGKGPVGKGPVGKGPVGKGPVAVRG